jgi:hypothetical protein
VIEAAVPVALPIWAPRLRRERRRIRHRLGRTRGAVTPRRMGSMERTVTLAAASLAVAPTEHPDADLVRLLDEVLAVAGAGPLPTAAPLSPGAHDAPTVGRRDGSAGTARGCEVPRPRAAAMVDEEAPR